MHEQGKQNWGVFYSMLKILAEAMEQKYISWAPQCVAMLLLQEEQSPPTSDTKPGHCYPTACQMKMVWKHSVILLPGHKEAFTRSNGAGLPHRIS